MAGRTTSEAHGMLGSHALVIGGSIAGLITARVLSERFDRVTILDRDECPTIAAPRAGVPQGRHGHGLLASGLRVLTALFPEVDDELRAAGAAGGDVVRDAIWFQHGCYKTRVATGLNGVLTTRPLLEGTVRAHVLRRANVRLREHTHVAELMTTADRRRVTGVYTGSEGDRGAIEADLVVDASGRSSRTAQWFARLGYAAPPVDEYAVDVGYATRFYRRRPHHLGGAVAALVAPTPPTQKRTGIMLAQEGDRWIVSLGGWLGDHPPLDELGYLEFARSLPAPDIHAVIRHAEPLTPPVAYRFPSNLRRRFERLSRLPERYLVVGDAVCSFNPTYGQGMSVAALDAMALYRLLGQATTLDGLPARHFEAVAKVVDTPWRMAVSGALAYPEVAGRRSWLGGLMNRYLNRVHVTAASDAVVCRRFFDVANLLAPPASLFRPSIVRRVLAGPRRPSVSGPAGRRPAVAALRAGVESGD